MTRLARWVIRGMSLFVLFLCIAAWAWSGTHRGWIGYTRGLHLTRCGTMGGVVGIEIRWLNWSAPARWEYDIRPLPSACYWSLPGGFPTVLGFRFQLNSGKTYWFACVPHWFLTLLAALALVYAWRKTRPKLSPATAFPVEVREGP